MGLQVRTFNGSITKDKGEANEKKYAYRYNRIVEPWSRTGKDVTGENPEGKTPTLSELMAYAQKEGFPTEIPIDEKTKEPTGASITQFLVDGINQHMNRTASSEVMNTEEAALEAVLKVFMKKRNCNREAALKILGAAFE
jgi:hypothetical protein